MLDTRTSIRQDAAPARKSGLARAFRRFLPLNRLPHKVKLRIARDVLKRESLTIKVFDFRLEVPLKVQGIGTVLTVFGHRELDHLHIIDTLLRPGTVVLDIGANIGYYAVIEGRRIGPDGFIYAFEPDPRNVAFLRRNLQLNGLADRSEVSPDAISDSNGSVTFQIAEMSNLNSIGRTRIDENQAGEARGLARRSYMNEIAVRTVALSDFLTSCERPVDLIRMDVEGHEVEILGSLAQLLERQPDFARAPRAIIFEPHSWEYTAERDLNAVLSTLMRHGYRITWLGSRDETRSPMHARGLKPVHTVREARGVTRGVYRDVAPDVALDLASRVDGVTTVCLEREAPRG